MLRTSPQTNPLARRIVIGALGVFLLMPTAGALAQEMDQAPPAAEDQMVPGDAQTWPAADEMAPTMDEMAPTMDEMAPTMDEMAQ